MEGTGGIEPPTRLLDDANGFEARGVPSATAPNMYLSTPEYFMGSPPSPTKGRGNVVTPPPQAAGNHRDGTRFLDNGTSKTPANKNPAHRLSAEFPGGLPRIKAEKPWT